ncbi:hypothetical protein CYMTET_4254 [Cymbomonas tetramitiformis]|uniref:Guanylate cyclase domain-containing protein n=1 Tax=Cymbomonas tetramitiformis TaxID=36881 RepID=A0AAE0H1G5_9CHLO|nr:hypothetical protein CYMTET_4254 [Cymbomonas tetramitiformis]
MGENGKMSIDDVGLELIATACQSLDHVPLEEVRGFSDDEVPTVVNWKTLFSPSVATPQDVDIIFSRGVDPYFRCAYVARLLFLGYTSHLLITLYAHREDKTFPVDMAVRCVQVVFYFASERTFHAAHKLTQRPAYRRALKIYEYIYPTFMLLSELANSVVREVYIPLETRCGSEQDVHCPSVTWSFAQTYTRMILLSAVLQWLILPFWFVVRLSALFVILLMPLCFQWGSAEGEDGTTFTLNNVNNEITLPFCIHIILLGCLLRTHFRLSLWSNVVRTKTKQLQTLEHLTRSALCSMVPERFCYDGLGQRELVPVFEHYPLVTVLFCSFHKDDTYRFDDPLNFLRLLGDLMCTFDELVERSGLCKVEHVAEDYVVASAKVQDGPAVSGEQWSTRRDAQQLVHLGHQLLNAGRSTKSACGKSLRFRVGISSGPVIGGIAGNRRRFYRLFGETVNTAARMCHHAPRECVHLSSSTEALLQGSDVPRSAHGPINVKGLGLMHTFIAHDLDPSSIASCEDSMERSPEAAGVDRLSARLDHDTQAEAGARAPEVQEVQPGWSLVQVPLASGNGVTGRKLDVLRSAAAVGPSGGHIEIEVEDGSNRQAGQVQAHAMGEQSGARRALASLWKLWDLRESDARRENTAKYARSKYEKDDASVRARAAGTRFLEFLEESAQITTFYGAFEDEELERLYLASRHTYELVEAQKRFLLCICLVDVLFFGGFYLSFNWDEWDSRLLVIGFVILCVHTATLAWCYSRATPDVVVQQKRFCSLLYFIGLLWYILLTGNPWCLMGIALALMLKPFQEEVQLSNLIIITFTPSIMSVALLYATVSVDGNWNFYILCPIIVSYSLHIGHWWNENQSNRATFLLEEKSILGQVRLQELFCDLIPSASARNFVLQKQLVQHRSMAMKAWSRHDCNFAMILAMDMVCFTKISSEMRLQDVPALLHDVWCIIDEVLEQSPEESQSDTNPDPPFKMDTIGDASIVVKLLQNLDQASRQLALLQLLRVAHNISCSLQDYSNTCPFGLPPDAIQMRMGLCGDQIIPGVIGTLRCRYHIFGKAVRKAVFLESRAIAGHVCLDREDYALIGNGYANLASLVSPTSDVQSQSPECGVLDQLQTLHAGDTAM